MDREVSVVISVEVNVGMRKVSVVVIVGIWLVGSIVGGKEGTQGVLKGHMLGGSNFLSCPGG